MSDAGIAPDRTAWRALTEEQRAWHSTDAARAAVAYARYLDRIGRVSRVVAGIVLLAVPIGIRLTQEATHRSLPHLIRQYPSIVWLLELVALQMIYFVVGDVVTRVTGPMRKEGERRLAIAVAVRPGEVPGTVVVRRRWQASRAIIGILVIGYGCGAGMWATGSSAGQSLGTAVACAALSAVAALALDVPLRRAVLRIDAAGLTVPTASRRRRGGDDVMVAWKDITTIELELDAIIVRTRTYIPTQRYSRFSKPHWSEDSPATAVAGGYRISLSSTGVRPEMVYWAAQPHIGVAVSV